MFRNFISETCTGTTGDLTLLGAQNGFIAFEDAYQDGDDVSYIVEDGNGINKCAGTGIINLPGNTITRVDDWTWNGTTYDDSPGGNLVLSGNTHVIRVAPRASRMLDWNTHDSWGDPIPSHITFNLDGFWDIGTTGTRARHIYTDNITTQRANIGDIVATGDHNFGGGESIWSSGAFIDISSGTLQSGGITTGSLTVTGSTSGISLTDLDNVTQTGAVSGEILMFSPGGSGVWENKIINISSLDDADTTGLIGNDLFGYNGTNWVPITLIENYGTNIVFGSGTLSIGSYQNTLKVYANVSGPQSVLNTSVKMQLNGANFNETDITLSAGTRANITTTGTYDILAEVRVDTDNRCELIIQLYINGVAQTNEIVSDYVARDIDQNTGSVQLQTSMQLVAGQYIEIDVEGDCDGTYANIITGSKLIIKRTK